LAVISRCWSAQKLYMPSLPTASIERWPPDSIDPSTVKRMHLLNADFNEVGLDFSDIDVVYLDPMFPQRNKSARAKKDMYLLQYLLGKLQDDPAMLELAIKIARRRVVVKRAKRSPTLGERKPDIEFKGSSSRYDVYLTGSGTRQVFQDSLINTG